MRNQILFKVANQDFEDDQYADHNFLFSPYVLCRFLEPVRAGDRKEAQLPRQSSKDGPKCFFLS
jgi:hypothetical protein